MSDHFKINRKSVCCLLFGKQQTMRINQFEQFTNASQATLNSHLLLADTYQLF